MNPDNIESMLGNSTPEENTLQKLQEAEKNSKNAKQKPEESSEKLDEDTIKQLFMTGENSEGLFTPKEKEEKDNPKHEEIHEEAKVTTKSAHAKGKYVKKFMSDVGKHPEKYIVNTPKGEMTIAEAMKKGYNPITKRFEKDKSPEEIKKKHLEGLNETDREAVDKLTSPSAAHIPAKDAETMGLPADSPMIAKREQPAVTNGLPEGMPTQQIQPEVQGVQDLNSLLGGGN